MPSSIRAAVDEFFLFGYVRAPGTIAATTSGQLASQPPCFSGPGLGLEARTRTGLPRAPAAPIGPAERAWETMREKSATRLSAVTRSRMVSDVPLGVFLSGGLDSTLVAAMTAAHSSEPLRRSPSAMRRRGRVNETTAAAAARPPSGSPSRGPDRRRRRPRARRRACSPGLTSRWPTARSWRCTRCHAFARERIKVAIGGEGADELFGGYRRYRGDPGRACSRRAERPARARAGASPPAAARGASRPPGGSPGAVGPGAAPDQLGHRAAAGLAHADLWRAPRGRRRRSLGPGRVGGGSAIRRRSDA